MKEHKFGNQSDDLFYIISKISYNIHGNTLPLLEFILWLLNKDSFSHNDFIPQSIKQITLRLYNPLYDTDSIGHPSDESRYRFPELENKFNLPETDSFG